ncbi:hypothetical protein [Foetidibacter luteolus]|uniref:hypothetical protein n=1 Tax=Foetidibacter luteolus TaxID=2608880 RepID=UPI00129BC5A5|nr:hypothetical protein [Foetidibacter luteolus]
MLKVRLLIPILIVWLLQNAHYASAQQPVKQFAENALLAEDSATLAKEFGANKEIPAALARPILVALSYFPELRQTYIRFEYRHYISPLAAKPRFFSIFRKGSKAKYIITISDSSNAFLSPILIKYMDYNARIGVIGHELSHVSYFVNGGFGRFIRTGIGHLSRAYMNRFEFATDSLCIAHGLGYQLLAWSRFIQKQFGNAEQTEATENSSVDKNERYMSPATVKRYIRMMPGVYGHNPDY